MKRTGYFAPVGLEEQLKSELKEIEAQYGRLIVAKGEPQETHWAQNIWYDLEEISFSSLSDAAKKLRSLQKLWSFYPHQFARKGALISEKLPYFSPKPIEFPEPAPQSPLGAWLLLDEKTLLAAPRTSSPFAQGEVSFKETKVPPGRAYLKLWEALTRLGKRPKPGDTCLEIGASPGSWTWALLELGAEVIAIDRAPLAIPPHPRLTFIQGNAFTFETQKPLDWIFSDVICYPEKLFEWVLRMKTLHPNARFVCTLKFQGQEDYGWIKPFSEIGRVLHLFHNKHELTWFSA